MKGFRGLAAAVAAVVLFAAGTARADVLFQFDENGNATVQNTVNGFFLAYSGALAPDPGPGGLPAALTYSLLGPPPTLVTGDVLLLEPGTLGVVSDLFRFNPNGTVVFYSDNADVDPRPNLADVGFPSALYTNTVSFVEQVIPGANGLFNYIPTAGQPGFVPGVTVHYTFISDAPEPSTLIGAATGAAFGLAYARRRRKRAS